MISRLSRLPFSDGAAQRCAYQIVQRGKLCLISERRSCCGGVEDLADSSFPASENLHGGHHFDGNYGRLAQSILDGFRRRAGLPGDGDEFGQRERFQK